MSRFRLLGAVLVCVLMTVPAVAAPPALAEEPVVLTIGVGEDLDSANPFTGLSSLAYEAFTLQ